MPEVTRHDQQVGPNADGPPGIGIVWPPANALILVRHGQTPLNADGRLRGRLDPDLDATGRAQVSRLGAWFATAPIRLIVSSPRLRAVRTAEAIAGPYGREVVVADSIDDRDYGPWAGRPEAEVVARFGSLDTAPGVEPSTAVLARARAEVDRCRDVLARGLVVLVTHDAVLRLLLGSLAPRRFPAGTPIDQATACWNLLLDDHGAWRLQDYNQQIPADGAFLPHV